MMKSVVLISVLVAMGQAQRPPYAGSAHRYPEVLTRFLDKQNSTTTMPTTTTTVRSSTPEVVDRLASTSTSTPAPNNAPSSSTATPNNAPSSTTLAPKTTTSSDAILYPSEELPVLSLGDAELVNRIKTWPRDKQPWWYINRGAIQEHLNPSTQTNVLRPEAAAKPFFAG